MTENSGLGIVTALIAAGVSAVTTATSIAVQLEMKKKAAEKQLKQVEESAERYGVHSGSFEVENVTGASVERDPVVDIRKWGLVAAAGLAAYLYLRR